MTSRTFDNVWSSLIVFCNRLITDLSVASPEAGLKLIDWETLVNVSELPNHDLLGPVGINLTEEGKFIRVNFSVSVSSYASDANLFRHRGYISEVFERMRPERQIEYFDAQTAQTESVLVCTDGTLISPMARNGVRPWQYVQASALLVPS